MPQWVLQCVNRKVIFEHSQISDVGMSRLRMQPKPDVLLSGAECAGLNCGKSSVYRHAELLHQGLAVRSLPIR